MHICVYAYTKETNLATLITQMELESIIINEVRQTQKEKYHIIILICEILKKEKANKPEFIDSENRLLVARGGWKGHDKMGEESQKSQSCSYQIYL